MQCFEIIEGKLCAGDEYWISAKDRWEKIPTRHINKDSTSINSVVRRSVGNKKPTSYLVAKGIQLSSLKNTVAMNLAKELGFSVTPIH